MHDFNHPHVMSLVGVCLNVGPGIAIVMPYMSNGSLVDYLKRERGSLELDNDDETDQVCGIFMIGLEQLFSIIYIIPSIAGIIISLVYTFRMHGFNFRAAFCTHACMQY